MSAGEFTPNEPPSGVTGGFAPSAPTDVKTVTFTPQEKTLQITSSPSDPTPTSAEKDEAADALIKELQSILKSIPTEEPRGSEDIYGLGIGIMWGSDDFVWQNVGPEGCGGKSDVQATDEDKKKFKRALEIADALVAKGVGS